MKLEPLPETPESHDPVWELLARRSQPRIPQDFVAQVMAEARLTPQENAPSLSAPKVVAFPATRHPGRLWASLAAAAAVVVGLYLHFQSTPNTTVASDQPPSAVSPTPMLAVNDEGSLEQELTAVQDMHALITVEDPTQLNDAQLFAFLN
jgi:hypothetical protein